MKFFKGFLILLISFIGGFSAFYVMNRYRSEDSVHVPLKSAYIEEGEKSVPRYEKIRDEVNFGGNFPDLRGASRKAVAGVVHIKSVAFTKAYVGNPLLDFIFGNEPQLRKVPKSMEIGSGVIISSDGYIVTNNHVVGENNEASVVLNDKREFSARIVGRDPATDLALLKINAKDLEYLEYGDSDNVSIGEWVLAIGNPYNLTSTVTAGIISAKARQLEMSSGQMNFESFLQTDAAVNPGSSGGALVDSEGKLIGINTAIQSPTGSYAGYSFAVPVNIVKEVVGDLMKYGRVKRAILGIVMGELNNQIANMLNVSTEEGVVIYEVMRGGTAYNAGLQRGDIIVEINGNPIRNQTDFKEEMHKLHEGDRTGFKILRRNHTITGEFVF